jgi:hypothetical protein
MATVQGSLHESEKALFEISVTLQDQTSGVSGSFRLPVQCAIDLHAPHTLVLADGRSVPITITRLSHFSGDVEFREARPAH